MGLQEQVVEVDRGGLGEQVLVTPVDAVDKLVRVALHAKAEAFDADELALGAGDGRQRTPGREGLLVHVDLVHRALDGGQLVGGVVDGKAPVEPDVVSVDPEQPGAEGVEGAYGQPLLPHAPI